MTFKISKNYLNNKDKWNRGKERKRRNKKGKWIKRKLNNSKSRRKKSEARRKSKPTSFITNLKVAMAVLRSAFCWISLRNSANHISSMEPYRDETRKCLNATMANIKELTNRDPVFGTICYYDRNPG